MGIKMKERIYVCHTYYHVYVTFLKELKLGPEQRGKATLLLSKMSICFENLKERVESTGLFDAGDFLKVAGWAHGDWPELPR